jgi:hypothetical protein
MASAAADIRCGGARTRTDGTIMKITIEYCTV